MAQNQIRVVVGTQQKCPFSQFGFKKSLGTSDCIAHLITDIQTAFSKNQLVSAIFLVIKGAYALLHHPSTISDLYA